MILWRCCTCGKDLEGLKDLVKLRVTPLPNQPRFHNLKLYCSQQCQDTPGWPLIGSQFNDPPPSSTD